MKASAFPGRRVYCRDVPLIKRSEAAWHGASPGKHLSRRRSSVPSVVSFPILSRDRRVEAPKPGVQKMKRRCVLALFDEPAPFAASRPCSSWHGRTSNFQDTGTNQEALHPTGSGRTPSWSEVDGVAASARVGLSLSRHGHPSSRVQARASEPFPAVSSPAHCSQGLVSLPASLFQWLWGPQESRLPL